MNTLAINFAQTRRRPSWLGLILVLLGVSAALVVWLNYAEAQADLTQAQARLTRAERSASANRRPSRQPTLQKEDDKSFSRVSTQLRRPWSGLLSDIDLISNPSVALLSVESQGQSRNLSMTGEAKTMADAVAYVNRLRQSSLIESVYLSQHEERQAGPVNVIRFSLEATWRTPQ
jgi:hypothetical protein